MQRITSRLIALLLLLGACSEPVVEAPGRERLRVVIPEFYQVRIQALMESKAVEFSFAYQDIDWVIMPEYSRRDSVFAPSLAARFDNSDPDADVFFIDLYRMQAYRPGWLTPLDTAVFGDPFLSFRPAFLQAAILDDHVYALPWSAKGNFLFYRKDLVPNPPKTWAELKTQCAEMPSRGISRKMRYCLLVSWESVLNDIYPLLWSLDEEGKAPIDSPKVVTLFKDLAAMLGQRISSGFVTMPSADTIHKVGQKIHERFAQREAVFMINWSNSYRDMKDFLSAKGHKMPELGIAPIPSAGSDDTNWSNIGNWGWIVPRAAMGADSRSAGRHTRALQFVRELTSKDAVAWLTKEYGLIPARRDVPLPAELKDVLSPIIVEALQSDLASGQLRVHDRGSDEFEHGYLSDALHDVLLCGSPNDGRAPSGRCARDFTKCRQSDLASDCIANAIKTRLSNVRQRIERIQDRGAKP